jgi:hypothetical protein
VPVVVVSVVVVSVVVVPAVVVVPGEHRHGLADPRLDSWHRDSVAAAVAGLGDGARDRLGEALQHHAGHTGIGPEDVGDRDLHVGVLLGEAPGLLGDALHQYAWRSTTVGRWRERLI